jgi:hypothetical protein
MVTPISLNGAGCAAAVPAVSVEAQSRATKVRLVESTVVSLLDRRARAPYRPGAALDRSASIVLHNGERFKAELNSRCTSGRIGDNLS